MNPLRNTLTSLFTNTQNIQNLSTTKKYAYATTGGLLAAVGLTGLSQLAYDWNMYPIVGGYSKEPLDGERLHKASSIMKRMGIEKKVTFVQEIMFPEGGGIAIKFLPGSWGKSLITFPQRSTTCNDADIVRHLSYVKDDVFFKAMAAATVAFRCVQVSKVGGPLSCFGLAMFAHKATKEFFKYKADSNVAKFVVNAEDAAPYIRKLENTRVFFAQWYKEGMSGGILSKLWTRFCFTPKGDFTLIFGEIPTSKRIETIKAEYYARNEPPQIQVKFLDYERIFFPNKETSETIFQMIKNSGSKEISLLGVNKISFDLLQDQDNIVFSTVDGDYYFDIGPNKLQTFWWFLDRHPKTANTILLEMVKDALSNQGFPDAKYAEFRVVLPRKSLSSQIEETDRKVGEEIRSICSADEYDLSKVRRKRTSSETVSYYIPRKNVAKQ